MKARDIMTPDPTVVTPEEPIAFAAALMRDRDVGMIPVVGDREHMRLEGVLTDRDIAIRCVSEKHDSRCRVQDHMTCNHLDVVHDNDDLTDVVRRMESDQIRRIPVIAEGGRLIGVIAQADLALKVGPDDPELVEEMLEEVSKPHHST